MLKKNSYFLTPVLFLVLCNFAAQWNSLPVVVFLSWKALLKKCQLADMKSKQPITNYIS